MPSRRHFLTRTAGAGLLGWLAPTKALLPLSPATASEARVTPDMVRLSPSIEPVVRLIENTPHAKCLEMMVEQLRGGLPYRQFLAALFLAGIRNVNPQPPGFKFHCVFVIHAAHQLSLDAPAGERLLPLLWALDSFKSAQQQDVEQGDFLMRPVKGPLPNASAAWSEFHTAMDDWDEERADRAIVALVRSRGAHEIIDRLWRYGARDYRNIGHKSIFVANTWRTLQTIGWQHAEPVLRSLVLGLLDFGKSERVNEYAFADQAYLPNAERASQQAEKLPADWTQAQGDPAATQEILQLIRTGNLDDASTAAVTQLVKGRARATAVWDAVHLAAGELMMRQPGIYGIHTVTSVNGLRYAYQMAAGDENRLLMLLQGIGWMCQFQNFMASRPQGLGDVKITELAPLETAARPQEAIEEIFSLVGKDPVAAAGKSFALAKAHPQPELFARAAGRLIFRKGTDAHDYKYAAAIFEDYRRVSPHWRPHMLATAVYHLRGSTLPDSPLMVRAQEAVRSL